MGFDPFYMIIFMGSMALSWLVGNQLKSKFKKYSQVPLPAGLSGKEVAERMLSENNITDVEVVSVPGFLSDHYHPIKKTVNLSPDVFNGRSVAAAAVAAHEVGHAIQHNTQYSFLMMRSRMVPVVQIGSNLSRYVLMAGFAVAAMSGSTLVLLIGILLFSLSTLFAFVTLPVEFDASKRALVWLNQTNITGHTHDDAKDALKWAAMTYVVAALASLAQLLYWVYRYNQMSNRR